MSQEEQDHMPPAIKQMVAEVEAAVAEAEAKDSPVETLPAPPEAVQPVEVAAPSEPAQTPPIQETPVEPPQAPAFDGPQQPGLQVPEAEIPEDDLNARLAKLEQAHAVLKGKYHEEVPVQARVIKERDAEILRLRGELESKSKHAAANSFEDIKAMSDEDFQATYGISDENMELGRDHWNTTVGMARLESRTQAEHLVETQIRPMQEAAGKTSVDGYYTKLTDRVPNWREVNVNDAFLDWLGPTRQQILDLSIENRDVQAASDIFAMYEQSQSAKTPAHLTPSIAPQVVPAPVARPTPPTTAPNAETAIERLTEELNALPGRSISMHAKQTRMDEIDAELRELQRASA